MNKTAVITGASGAIGSETALALAKEGYQLLLCGHSSKEKLEETRDRCLRHTPTCLTICGDMGDSRTAKNIADTALRQFGRIDVLINNAGVSQIGLVTDVTDDEWFHMLNTNLSSAFFLCRQILPAMIHEKAGRILNISSIWGSAGASCEAAYSASKGGLNAFTKALAKELAPSNIQVNAIACGVIDTDMNKRFSMEDIAMLKGEIPADRIGTIEEVARLVIQIINSPTYLTGQIIAMDGGWQ